MEYDVGVVDYSAEDEEEDPTDYEGTVPEDFDMYEENDPLEEEEEQQHHLQVQQLHQQRPMMTSSLIKRNKNNNNNYQQQQIQQRLGNNSRTIGGSNYTNRVSATTISNGNNKMTPVRGDGNVVSKGINNVRYNHQQQQQQINRVPVPIEYEEYSEEDLEQDQEDVNGYYDNGGGGMYENSNNNGYQEYEDQEQEEYDQFQYNDGQGESSYLEDEEDNGHGSNNYGNGIEEDDEYPDTLQYCEAQFDEGGLEDDDEEARGLPPPPTRGNYGEGDEEQGPSSSRITTNESGIRIVESSTILEPEMDDDQEYEQYEDYREPSIPISSFLKSNKRLQLFKTRKMRPEKAAAEAILRQLRNADYDHNKPNILARKLMGVASQTVQAASRPPPMTKKPLKQFQMQQKPTQTSLESILRQKQRPSPSVQNYQRIQPKTASSLLLNNSQLKIKTSHGIPPIKSSLLNNNAQQRQAKVQRMLQNSKNSNSVSSSSSRLFLQNQSSSPVSVSGQKAGTSIIRSSPKVQNFQYQQQANSAQLRVKNNGSTTPSPNNLNASSGNNRISISSIQMQLQAQQQKNGMQQQQQQQQQQTKPLKNVPRCHVCKRTFATNQVLQRHMALHGPIATITESETGEYKCEMCFEEFENPLSLAIHMQQAHDDASSLPSALSPSSSAPGVHRCRVCYRTFTCLESLKAHSLLHDGEFKCRACRRGFSDWNSLEEHEATHKRYNCQWCEKYFMNSGNLKAHERIHTGERPYKCNDCPKAFKQLGGLQYHLKTNPTHKPQKYHKMEAGLEENNEDQDGSGNGGYLDSSMLHYESGGEEYDDGGTMSILDIAAGAGF